jgi:hypothetical protein
MMRLGFYAFLSSIYFVTSGFHTAFGAEKHHMRLEIVLRDGTQDHLVAGTVKITSAGAMIEVDTEDASYVERDLVCDETTSFSAQPGDPFLTPSPKTVACTVSTPVPGAAQTALVALQVKTITLSTASSDGANAIKEKLATITASNAGKHFAIGFNNLDSALGANDSATVAHVASALAATLRDESDVKDADFLSVLASVSLGQRFGIDKPVAFDASQNKLVATQALVDAMAGYSESKGLTSLSPKKIIPYSAMMQSLSGHSYGELMTKSMSYAPHT